MRKILCTAALFTLTACAAPPPPGVPEPRPDLAHEGVAPHVWAEPMVDVVEVPPGLDPEGHYYRPAHKSVVEIRQGKWQYYKDKDAQ